MASEPLFDVGQLVHHRKFDYRGVIVGFDPTCQAAEEWYTFQTQGAVNKPTKEQPWYHVLVDGATHTTYVAQQNLEPAEERDEPIAHPLLDKFFQTFLGGRYYKDNLN